MKESSDCATKVNSEHSNTTSPVRLPVCLYLCVPTLVETASSPLLDWKGTKNKKKLKVMAISHVQEVQHKQKIIVFCIGVGKRIQMLSLQKFMTIYLFILWIMFIPFHISGVADADTVFMCSDCMPCNSPEAKDSSNYHLKQTQIILL